MRTLIAVVVLAFGSGKAPADAPLRSETNYAPSWSPDGQRIAFEAKIDGRFAIVVMNADGTGLRRLTTGPADDFASSWSPDGPGGAPRPRPRHRPPRTRTARRGSTPGPAAGAGAAPGGTA